MMLSLTEAVALAQRLHAKADRVHEAAKNTSDEIAQVLTRESTRLHRLAEGICARRVEVTETEIEEDTVK